MAESSTILHKSGLARSAQRLEDRSSAPGSDAATDAATDADAGGDQSKNPFLVALGHRARALRSRKGMTRKALALAADSKVEQVLDNRAVSSDVDDASSDKPELNPVEDKKIEPDARQAETFADDAQPHSEGEAVEQNR